MFLTLLSRHRTRVLLPLDGITILTVIPKWMPTIDGWDLFFNSVSSSGYNMVHFAPINTRGSSNSPYSIYDQLGISDDLYDAVPHELTEETKHNLMRDKIELVHQEFGILSVTDVVWNHTACNSKWLEEHPEAGYNLRTAPHLRPAYEVDEAIMEFSAHFSTKYHLNATLKSEEDLTRAMDKFRNEILPAVRLWEFYVLNVQDMTFEFRKHWNPDCDRQKYANLDLESLGLKGQASILRKDAVVDPKDGRFSKHLKISELVVPFVARLLDQRGKGWETEDAVRTFDVLINEMNLEYYQECDSDSSSIVEQTTHRARYLRVSDHGPKLGPVSLSDPLVDTYFTRLESNSRTANLHPDEMKLANNGWIWNADPLMNFAGPQSKAYVRREVIAWGDCVKLRYGDMPEDNPWLWEHMAEYTRKMARLFHGFRIDNCHSTPLHVASYLLDIGRAVRPDLYVFAELFTGSEEKDILFVSNLGINSLIREAMNAWDSFELSRLVHRQGGQPVESIPLEILGHRIHRPHASMNGNHHSKASPDLFIEVKGSAPHALFMDCTHDNETPHQKRTAEDTLPQAALVCMSNCAVGSVKGYDEIVPTLLNVVTETRKYRIPDSYEGILPARSTLNVLHTKMARDGYTEIHVHHENEFISVHRVHPLKHDGYLLIARTAFSKNTGSGVHSPIRLRNQMVKIIESVTLQVFADAKNQQGHSYVADATPKLNAEDEHADVPLPTSPTHIFHHMGQIPGGRPQFRRRVSVGVITGLPSTLHFSNQFTRKVSLQSYKFGEEEDSEFETVVTMDQDHFVPGSFVLLRTWVAGTGALWYTSDSDLWPPGLFDAIKNLGVVELNVALFRAEGEEQDVNGDGVYDVPQFGALRYCGLQGIVSALQPAAKVNDLGHSVFNNLRQGPWLMDYAVNRLAKYSQFYPALTHLREWLSARLRLVAKLGPSFTPKYFTLVMFAAYNACRYRAIEVMDGAHICPDISTRRVSSLETFSQSLALTSVQLYGQVKSTGLLAGKYPGKLGFTPDISELGEASLAAGLPHFSSRHMRCWGRDVFISLRGMLLLTGNYAGAREHLISFGSTLRHGLIPNLLDRGHFPRYNARDATWWWMWGVQEYCRGAPEGMSFLKTEVFRRFPPLPEFRGEGGGSEGSDDGDSYTDVNDPRTYKYKSTIAELCQEILQRHATGIKFREWNAGPQLDHAMSDAGFNIEVGTRWSDGTGFVFGGNRYNCGTWMDKMGDSEKAGNRGEPATPRDGVAIEILGLVKAALRWISQGVSANSTVWPWAGVKVKDESGERLVTYKEWNDMIQQSFERYFYVPIDKSQDSFYNIKPSLVNRRGIYKDVLGSSLEYADYQLRPNMYVTMVLAPELFTPSHAIEALRLGRDVLLAPLGIKTLDPADWNYRGVYDNGNDSNDRTVAHGFNYHNGPEWVWVAGYFLRAYVRFCSSDLRNDAQFDPTAAWVQRRLLVHKLHIFDTMSNPFAGLPELTNEAGAFCYGSCPTQAWSSGTLLELLHDLHIRR
ncbi:glucanotransferase domain of glycogen debranching enzyme-domain-containing protein [Cladochytrium replicatum]|nr:glucanotransferase domain of glycogen debranching enzyme-domain-containing protein [Cladochytrium replicatum]